MCKWAECFSPLPAVFEKKGWGWRAESSAGFALVITHTASLREALYCESQVPRLYRRSHSLSAEWRNVNCNNTCEWIKSIFENDDSKFSLEMVKPECRGSDGAAWGAERHCPVGWGAGSVFCVLILHPEAASGQAGRRWGWIVGAGMGRTLGQIWVQSLTNLMT